jgi:hypothetical protein
MRLAGLIDDPVIREQLLNMSRGWMAVAMGKKKMPEPEASARGACKLAHALTRAWSCGHNMAHWLARSEMMWLIVGRGAIAVQNVSSRAFEMVTNAASKSSTSRAL